MKQFGGGHVERRENVDIQVPPVPGDRYHCAQGRYRAYKARLCATSCGKPCGGAGHPDEQECQADLSPLIDGESADKRIGLGIH